MAFLLKKPEVVYERALEFISVGRDKDALNSLYDLIKDNRRKKWNETHEKIMLKFVELCVDSRNVLLAKDGLYHYKNLTQQAEPQSLGVVIEKFMCLAEQRASEAQKSSIEKIEEIGDLEDTVDIPEKMLLAAVTLDVAQDRMDRTVLGPWMRFLWDAYRNLLELLRHNVYIEQLYQQVACRVFSFCVQYQRRGEFRRLCENLRFHLQKLVLAQELTDPNTKKPPAYLIRMTNPASLMMMLETRLDQLNTAIRLDLWMEAFKSALDVHSIMQKFEELVKDKEKRIKPTIYMDFYDKLALVLLKGGNTLYHAAALLQKFCVCKSFKRITSEEIQDLSNRVLLASLGIVSGMDTCSPLSRLLDIEDLQLENSRIFIAILRLSAAPTCSGILKQIFSLNISFLASDCVRSLFSYFRSEQDPLKIPGQVHKKLKDMMDADNSDYHQYTEFILKAVAIRTMKKVSFLYDSLPLEHFSQIIPYYDQYEFERFIVELSKHAYGKFKVDHREKMIFFQPIDDTLAVSLEDEFDDGELSGPGLYNIRLHIGNLYSELESLNWDVFGDELEADALNKLKHHVEAYKNHMEAEEKLILERQSAMEDYKNSSKKLKGQLQKERLNQELAEAAVNEERWRLEQEKRREILKTEQEQLRKAAETEALEKHIKQKHIEEMQRNPIFQHLVVKFGIKALHDMDLEALKKEELTQREAERKEREARLLQQQKNYDYMVRAFHSEEIVLLKPISDQRRKLATQQYEKFQADSIEQAKQTHQRSIVTYGRLQKAKVDAAQFMVQIFQSNLKLEKDDGK